jgi:hypothetical protein
MTAVPTAEAVTFPFESTDATFGVFDVQLISVTTPYGAGVAPSEQVFKPAGCRYSVSLVGDTAIPVGGILFCTVMSQVAVIPPQEAVIVALPTATAVTSPLVLTVAISLLPVVHVTVFVLAFEGLTVPVS